MDGQLDKRKLQLEINEINLNQEIILKKDDLNLGLNSPKTQKSEFVETYRKIIKAMMPDQENL